MAEPRLAAALWVNALVRRVNAAGDFATVLHRGDDIAGSVVIVHRARNGETRALQRVMSSGEAYHWRVAAAGESIENWLVRQRTYDPDLWVLELDTADVARFIDETIAPG